MQVEPAKSFNTVLSEQDKKNYNIGQTPMCLCDFSFCITYFNRSHNST